MCRVGAFRRDTRRSRGTEDSIDRNPVDGFSPSPIDKVASPVIMSNRADNCGVVASDLTSVDYAAEGVYFETAHLMRIKFVRCDRYWALFAMAKVEESHLRAR